MNMRAGEKQKQKGFSIARLFRIGKQKAPSSTETSEPTEGKNDQYAALEVASISVPHQQLTEPDQVESKNRISTESHPAASLSTTSSTGNQEVIKQPSQPNSISLSTPNEQTLWEQAFNRLRNDRELDEMVTLYEKLLSENSEATTDVSLQTRAARLVDEKMAIMLQKQWIIRFGNLQITVRAVVEKIIKVIRTVKDFGSEVASLNPVHVGIPWAGVCMLLPLILNDSEQLDSAMNGLEKISNLVRHYAMVESIYLRDGIGKSKNDLELSVTNLYAKLLEFQVRAIHYYHLNTLHRTGRNLVKLDKWDIIIGEIEELDTMCKERMALASSEKINSISKMLGKLEDRVSKQDRLNEKILSWLSHINITEYHQLVRNQKLGKQYWESGQWLLTHQKYKQWRETDSGTLWLQGGMGAGKTCLSSIVISQLFKESNDQPLAYFYCSSKTPTDPAEVIRSLLVQLAYKPDGSSIFEALVSKYNDREKLNLDLSLDSWVMVLIEISKTYKKATNIVIDALDEYSGSYELLEGLKKVQDNSQHVKLFFTSRPTEESVLGNFPSLICITINQPENNADVEHFIQTEMVSKRRLYKSGLKDRTDLQARLSQILLIRGQWMFRWIQLQLAIFLDTRNPEAIKEKLEKLENNSGAGVLNHAYDEIFQMNTSDSADRELATAALKWVLCSFEPLNLGTLVALLTQKDQTTSRGEYLNGNYLLALCKNFILANDTSGIVQLSHDSVRDWLKVQKSIDGELEYSLARAHAQAAETCLLHLRMIDFRHIGRVPNDPTRYTMVYWAYHCEKSYAQRGKGLLKNLFDELVLNVDETTPLANWFVELKNVLDNHYMANDRIPGYMFDRLRSVVSSYLYLACIFGFHEALENVQRYNQRTLDRGLLLAVRYGQCEIFHMLLDIGADINSCALLEEAIKQGHSQMVELLFQNGADPNIGAPLAIASGCGDIKMVQLLLDAEVDINKNSPLVVASIKGHSGIVRLLLDRGANVNHDNPLKYAVRKGYVNIVEMLLDRGADANCDDLLIYAVREKHVNMVEILLDRGADASRGNLLANAIAGGNERIMRRLLESGADPNVAEGSFSVLPLVEASEHGNLLFVQLLLDHGARINEKHPGIGTALSVALSYGFEPIARLLLERGAEITSGEDGDLEIARKRGFTEVENLILQREASASKDTSV